MKQSRRFPPISWISTLYFSEGLPYFAVNVMSVILYTRMGVGLKDMALYTGLLYLPWVVKPFWSSLVDILATKRRWILAMQSLVAIAFAALAVALPFSGFFAATLAIFWIMAFLSATHDIAADGFYMLGLEAHDQAAYVGLRNTFYRLGSLFGQGVLVMLAGLLEERTGSVPAAWATTFGILSILFVLLFAWHAAVLPRTERKQQAASPEQIMHQIGQTFSTFFTKKGVWRAIVFILTYRLGEALMLKIAPPFLLAPLSEGGMALTTAQVGFINGTVGVICLLAGGIVGGLCVARSGLGRWLWPMAMALTIPSLIYCYLALHQHTSLLVINAGIGLEQFGYGFGFTAFMLYLLSFCEGEYATSHYAFCTGIMALGMMLPGMAAGWLCELAGEWRLVAGATGGFAGFFLLAMACNATTFLACALIRFPRTFGKK